MTSVGKPSGDKVIEGWVKSNRRQDGLWMVVKKWSLVLFNLRWFRDTHSKLGHRQHYDWRLRHLGGVESGTWEGWEDVEHLQWSRQRRPLRGESRWAFRWKEEVVGKTCEHAGGEDDVEQGDVGGGRAHYHRRKQGTWVLICFPIFLKLYAHQSSSVNQRIGVRKVWCSPIMLRKACSPIMQIKAHQSWLQRRLLQPWRPLWISAPSLKTTPGSPENQSDNNWERQSQAVTIRAWQIEVRCLQTKVTLVDIVIRKGWPIAITAWPAKVNQNLTKEHVKENLK